MTEEIRTQILDAADARFRKYGFGKTTMAEIASDIDMSTANLYRYFENKVAIGTAMSRRCLCDRETLLNEIVLREGVTESERLELFVQGVLDQIHDEFSNEPKLSELVDTMSQKCPELFQEFINSDKRQIKKILQKGIERDEFDINDVDETTSRFKSTRLSKSDITSDRFDERKEAPGKKKPKFALEYFDDPEEIRNAVILKEILDRPRALRRNIR